MVENQRHLKASSSVEGERERERERERGVYIYVCVWKSHEHEHGPCFDTSSGWSPQVVAQRTSVVGGMRHFRLLVTKAIERPNWQGHFIIQIRDLSHLDWSVTGFTIYLISSLVGSSIFLFFDWTGFRASYQWVWTPVHSHVFVCIYIDIYIYV